MELDVQHAGPTLTKAAGRALKWEFFAWTWLLRKGDVTGLILLGPNAVHGYCCLVV